MRQDYRATGTLPIQPILDAWIAGGMPTDRTLDGVKANVETYNALEGTGRMRMKLVLDGSQGALACE